MYAPEYYITPIGMYISSLKLELLVTGVCLNLEACYANELKLFYYLQVYTIGLNLSHGGVFYLNKCNCKSHNQNLGNFNNIILFLVSAHTYSKI